MLHCGINRRVFGARGFVGDVVMGIFERDVDVLEALEGLISVRITEGRSRKRKGKLYLDEERERKSSKGQGHGQQGGTFLH